MRFEIEHKDEIKLVSYKEFLEGIVDLFNGYKQINSDSVCALISKSEIEQLRFVYGKNGLENVVADVRDVWINKWNNIYADDDDDDIDMNDNNGDVEG